MESLRRISIRSRVNAAMGLTALTLGLLGGGGWLAVSRAQQDFAGFAQRHLPLVVAVNQAREALGQLHAFDETDVAINYSMPDLAQRSAEQGLALLARAEAPLRALTAADQAEAVERARQLLAAYRAQVEPVFKAAGAGQLPSTAAGKRALEGAKQRIAEAETLLGALGQQLDGATHALADGIAARNAASSRALAVLALLALALLLPLMWATLRSILQPLVRSREVAARIARGELSVDIHDSGRDETAALMRTLGEMQQSLRDMVSGIRATAGFVASASNEIAAGNLDLSQRTETTAAGLEAAASGMAVLNGQLMDSARNAQQAGQLAVQAAEATASGGQRVLAVAELMGGIATSSRRIAEIVDVVDGIARRTNILALNAGVEAARAGDQGRGFAVVAQEVRTLSLRVGESAQQIKALVDQAAHQVQQGTHQSQQAGQTMDQVVHTARAVSGAMRGVAESVSGQSREMARVNDAVMQLDKLTQQNSALVEQTAAAAGGLRDQAQRLEALVGAFKLPADA
ncbi:HAMP domain-containing protein [Aquincola sp. S2]|uniref:HAMP domain-containing protein n=1 Tax=Pseudaquabacterium terrae TaxID=2732868 RepID=A0ABX2EP54_9BURK|nr:methyl-accepting chemotaxis protein [Aquabacterium terrae]NRF70437.1 HAMP domain-containing protein [Aquabacterium terrae]